MKNYTDYAQEIAKKAWESKSKIKFLTTNQKNEALLRLSKKLQENKKLILKENQKDLDQAKDLNLSPAMQDRLRLDEKRLDSIIQSVLDIVGLPDPVGQVIRGVTLPNGIQLITKKVPIGVLLVIYESRPNVTIEVASLCFKSGNVCILRGGKEAIFTNQILANLFIESLEEEGIAKDAILFINKTDRALLEPLLKLNQYIDIVVPRGGEGLIQTVTNLSTIPIVKHDKGVVNAFVDESADKEKTIQVILNSKTQRPGVCNALENLFIHEKYPYKEELLQALLDAGVELLEDQFEVEFLDLRLSYKIVTSIDEAIDLIRKYTSGHTELILSNDHKNIQKFQNEIDSAGIYVNCSTRFHDGGQYGLGAEIGISTGKLHVRGPMGLEHLTTTTTYLLGNGHVRT